MIIHSNSNKLAYNDKANRSGDFPEWAHRRAASAVLVLVLLNLALDCLCLDCSTCLSIRLFLGCSTCL